MTPGPFRRSRVLAPVIAGLALAASWSPALCAADAAAQLEGFLRDVASLEAEFTQTLVETDSDREQVSRGRLYLQRPDRFRWEYQEPVPQLVVADGRNLWLYDPDLEQVTVRPLDDGLASTPAALLSGEGDLDEAFDRGAVYSEDGVDWIELKPRGPDADFQGVRVGFSGGTIAAMELIDALGQLTRIRFTDVETNVELDGALFVFEPPPGADVLRDSDF